MKKHKKIIYIIIACIVCAGVAAIYTWNSGESPEPPHPVLTDIETETDVDINDIPEIAVNPAPIITLPEPETVADPLPEPEQSEQETIVSLTEPVEKPAVADEEIHEKGEGKEPPEPYVSKPQQPAPQQPSGPKGGETNSQGQKYVPGFGWIAPSGPNHGEQTGSSGDINKQIGEM